MGSDPLQPGARTDGAPLPPYVVAQHPRAISSREDRVKRVRRSDRPTTHQHVHSEGWKVDGASTGGRLRRVLTDNSATLKLYERPAYGERRTNGSTIEVRPAERQHFIDPDEGLTAGRATDLVFALFNHETFLALTRDAQWTTDDYKAWLYLALRGQLADATDTGRDALRSLSYEDHVS